MGQHNHTRVFSSRTNATPTVIQQDSRCRTLFPRPDQRCPRRMKGIRNIDCQPLKTFDHHHIKCNLCISLLLVDGKDRRTRLSIRPSDKHTLQFSSTGHHTRGGLVPPSLRCQDTITHRHSERQSQRLDIRTCMPTAMNNSVTSVNDNGTGTNDNASKNSSKITKGNNGMSMSDTTTRAGRG